MLIGLTKYSNDYNMAMGTNVQQLTGKYYILILFIGSF